MKSKNLLITFLFVLLFTSLISCRQMKPVSGIETTSNSPTIALTPTMAPSLSTDTPIPPTATLLPSNTPAPTDTTTPTTTPTSTNTATPSSTPTTIYIPLPTNTPLPTVTPILPTYVCSPHGDVPFGAKAYSPDGTKYAREVEPKDRGYIGIFDRDTDELLILIDVRQHPQGDFPNPLKGLALSAGTETQLLAVMFHSSSGGHISIVSVETGMEISYLSISKWYHCMRFSADGTQIIAEGDTLDIP